MLLFGRRPKTCVTAKKMNLFVFEHMKPKRKPMRKEMGHLSEGFYDECSLEQLREHAETIEREIEDLEEEELELALQKQVLIDHREEVAKKIARNALRLVVDNTIDTVA